MWSEKNSKENKFNFTSLSETGKGRITALADLREYMYARIICFVFCERFKAVEGKWKRVYGKL